MNRTRVLAVGGLVLLALTGCANGGGSASAAGDPPATVVEASPGALVVTTTYQPGSGGSMYIEGALADLILRDSDGNKVDTQTKMPGKKITFPDLEPGTYTLEPALRPCDANCGYLDGRVDDCIQTIEIDGDASVRVDFTVGEPCSVHSA